MCEQEYFNPTPPSPHPQKKKINPATAFKAITANKASLEFTLIKFF